MTASKQSAATNDDGEEEDSVVVAATLDRLRRLAVALPSNLAYANPQQMIAAADVAIIGGTNDDDDVNWEQKKRILLRGFCGSRDPTDYYYVRLRQQVAAWIGNPNAIGISDILKDLLLA